MKDINDKFLLEERGSLSSLSQVKSNESGSLIATRKFMKKRSIIWEHFTHFESNKENKYKCNYCGQVYKCSSKNFGISTLKIICLGVTLSGLNKVSFK